MWLMWVVLCWCSCLNSSSIAISIPIINHLNLGVLWCDYHAGHFQGLCVVLFFFFPNSFSFSFFCPFILLYLPLLCIAGKQGWPLNMFNAKTQQRVLKNKTPWTDADPPVTDKWGKTWKLDNTVTMEFFC